MNIIVKSLRRTIRDRKVREAQERRWANRSGKVRARRVTDLTEEEKARLQL